MNDKRGKHMISMERFGKPVLLGEEKKKKGKSFISVVLFLICAGVVVLVLTINIEHLIRWYVVSGQEETWTASIASYWGGIIGGFISGVLAFLGVFYTIKYYKDSDAQKERAAVQPFLLVKAEPEIDSDLQEVFTIGKVFDEKKLQKKIGISIQNIGNGFATILVLHIGTNYGGVAFKKVILTGDYVHTAFVIDLSKIQEGIEFDIQYIDSKTNEYFQKYIIKAEGDGIEIENGYPQLFKE